MNPEGWPTSRRRDHLDRAVIGIRRVAVGTTTNLGYDGQLFHDAENPGCRRRSINQIERLRELGAGRIGVTEAVELRAELANTVGMN